MGVLAPLRVRRRQSREELRARAALSLSDADEKLREARAAVKALFDLADNAADQASLVIAQEALRRAELATGAVQRELVLLGDGGEAA